MSALLNGGSKRYAGRDCHRRRRSHLRYCPRFYRHHPYRARGYGTAIPAHRLVPITTMRPCHLARYLNPSSTPDAISEQQAIRRTPRYCRLFLHAWLLAPLGFAAIAAGVDKLPEYAEGFQLLPNELS